MPCFVPQNWRVIINFGEYETLNANKQKGMLSFWSKTDIVTAYGCQSCQQFERRVGRDVLERIGWKAGKQFFSPNQVRILFEAIGKPLEKAEIR